MGTIHFLNVRDGGCSIIKHNSGHVTMIDVCNANSQQDVTEAMKIMDSTARQGIRGNFQQKRCPVNPIEYLKKLGIKRIFRYIQTHPDMDHMDGIEALFDEFSPTNFWDTCNTKEMQTSNWNGSPYRKSDWQFYKKLRDTDSQEDPKRLTLYSGARGRYYNEGEDGDRGGDGLHILAPTKELVKAANENGEDYNDCSYVILYQTGGNRIVFAGDSHDKTWEHILNNHKELITNIDLLIAPHHGRSSDRSYEFLETLRPTLTFFGNAPSDNLAYDAWGKRDLKIITNNQANCMVVDVSSNPMKLYVTHEQFAMRENPHTQYNDYFKAWYMGSIT